MSEHPWVARARRRAGGRLTVFAHRGGAGLRPENTRAAFAHAATLGVDGCELDVRLSRDGEVVVIHDATLERTTDADGLVSALTASELARVDAGHRFKPEDGFPWRARGEGVPRLADILADHPTLPFIIELKGTDPAVAEAATALVAAAGAVDRVCFGGFADVTLAAARRAQPTACTSAATEEIRRALYKSYVWWPLGRVPYQAYQVPEVSGGTRVVSKRFIRQAHRAGKVLHVWTVNAPDDIERLQAWGVDGVITDRPDVALAVPKTRLTVSDVAEP
jgi:glycerophosphoryl diester phosphodiesterase